MITLAYLRPDDVIAIPCPAKFAEPGWNPGAYCITYGGQAKEYRIGLMEMRRYEQPVSPCGPEHDWIRGEWASPGACQRCVSGWTWH